MAELEKETESENYHKTLHKLAADNSAGVLVQPGNEGRIGMATTMTSGSIAYYLADHGKFFPDGASFEELPMYAAFCALCYLSVKSLRSICGKQKSSTQIKGVLNGASSGFSGGATLAGLAFGQTTDIMVTGGATAAGGLLGFLATRRGRKIHRCGQSLPCDTWICTKCQEIIDTDFQSDKAIYWTLLEVCQYLFESVKFNSVKAIAFLEFSDLLPKGRNTVGEGIVWRSKTVKKAVKNHKKVKKFSVNWYDFMSTQTMDQDVDTCLRKWRIYLERAKNPLRQSEEEANSGVSDRTIRPKN